MGIVKLADVAPVITVPPALLFVVALYHWYVGVAFCVTLAATVRLPVMLPAVTVVFVCGWVLIVMTGVTADTFTVATFERTEVAPVARTSQK